MLSASEVNRDESVGHQPTRKNLKKENSEAPKIDAYRSATPIAPAATLASQ